MTSTSHSRRWEYSDEMSVKGYRSAARSVAWLAIGQLLSMYIIYSFFLFVAIIVKLAGSLTPDFFMNQDPYVLNDIISSVTVTLLSDEIFTNVLTIAVSLLSVAIPLLMYKTMRKKKLGLTSLFKPSIPKKMPLVIILAFGIGYMATYAGLLVFSLLQGIGIQLITPELPFPSSTAGIILYFIAIAIVAPLTEEIMFRGVMLNELKHFGNTAAIVITSLLFGFIHGTPYAMFYATAIGLVLAYITIKTGSIVYSVITHMLFNSASFVLQYITTVTPEYEASLINSGFEIVIFSISVVSLFWLLRSNYDLSLPGSSCSVISRRHYKAGMRRPVVIVFFALTILISLTQFSIG